MEENNKVDAKLNWGHYKESEHEILKTKLLIADRADIVYDLRRVYKDFHEEFPPFHMLATMQKWIESLSEQMLEIVDGITWEQISAEEFEDPYEHLMPRFGDCQNDEDLFHAVLVFNYVRPFGERLLNAHRLVLEDVAAEKAQEGEGDGE